MICLNNKYSTTKLLTDKKPKDCPLNLPENTDRKGEGGLRTKGYFKKSYSDKPLISIVTVVYNGEKFLEEAIESVLNQKYDNIEYIIIDGGSSDRTVDIIKKYEDKIDYWVSEPDEGQSDAFIKAFSISQGEWLTWLNGDDLLLAGAINELVKTAQKYPFVTCFTGNIIWTTADKIIIECRKGEKWNNFLPKLGILNVYGPTTFFKKSLYNSVKGINKNLHYKMDTDLWWQFYVSSSKFMRLHNYTWLLRVHENAKTTAQYFKDNASYDENHSSRIRMRQEDDIINKQYRKNISNFGKIYLSILRGVSLPYLSSLWDTIYYKDKYYTDIFKGKK